LLFSKKYFNILILRVLPNRLGLGTKIVSPLLSQNSFINKDLDKTKAYVKEGYKTLFIWEHELKNLSLLKKKIETFIVSNLV